MNTQLTLDDEILQQAMRLTGLNSAQEVVEAALRELVIHKQQNDRLAEAFGKYHWEGDLEAMRSNNDISDFKNATISLQRLALIEKIERQLNGSENEDSEEWIAMIKETRTISKLKTSF